MTLEDEKILKKKIIAGVLTTILFVILLFLFLNHTPLIHEAVSNHVSDMAAHSSETWHDIIRLFQSLGLCAIIFGAPVIITIILVGLFYLAKFIISAFMD